MVNSFYFGQLENYQNCRPFEISTFLFPVGIFEWIYSSCITHPASEFQENNVMISEAEITKYLENKGEKVNLTSRYSRYSLYSTCIANRVWGGR